MASYGGRCFVAYFYSILDLSFSMCTMTLNDRWQKSSMIPGV
jgi:hypothetical protein